MLCHLLTSCLTLVIIITRYFTLEDLTLADYVSIYYNAYRLPLYAYAVFIYFLLCLLVASPFVTCPVYSSNNNNSSNNMSLTSFVKNTNNMHSKNTAI